MASKRIVCTEKVRTSHGHDHISVVGATDDPSASQANEKLTVGQARAQLSSAYGDRYFTIDPATGKRANVEPFTCYGVETLRSSADSVTGNNLDHLRTCSWTT